MNDIPDKVEMTMARLKYSFCVFISLGHKPMQILASHNVWLGATSLVRCLHQVGVPQKKEPGWGRGRWAWSLP
jgi:hypothetical protein